MKENLRKRIQSIIDSVKNMLIHWISDQDNEEEKY